MASLALRVEFEKTFMPSPPISSPTTKRRPSLASFDPEDLIIAGRGSVDAKGSVAAQVFATLETLDTQPGLPRLARRR
jgi:acetylornithine deacetylase